MYYVYLLRSINFPNQIYIGLTDHIADRLKVHNAGRSIHTSKYVPWTVETLIGFDNKLKAAAFEKYLKSGSGKSFLKRHF